MTEVLIACLSFLGTVLGSLSGVLVSSKLVNYRLQQLEEKVSAHNHFAMRLPVVEAHLEAISQRVVHLENAWEREGA